MTKWKLPWEEEQIKMFIDLFQCNVMDMVSIEENFYKPEVRLEPEEENEEEWK